jgi:hypothetical protein
MDHMMFQPALSFDKPGRIPGGRSGRPLPIDLRASCRQHIVGARPSQADHGVRSLIDRGKLLIEGVIGLGTFDAQTFVGVFAL